MDENALRIRVPLIRLISFQWGLMVVSRFQLGFLA